MSSKNTDTIFDTDSWQHILGGFEVTSDDLKAGTGDWLVTSEDLVNFSAELALAPLETGETPPAPRAAHTAHSLPDAPAPVYGGTPVYTSPGGYLPFNQGYTTYSGTQTYHPGTPPNAAGHYMAPRSSQPDSTPLTLSQTLQRAAASFTKHRDDHHYLDEGTPEPYGFHEAYKPSAVRQEAARAADAAAGTPHTAQRQGSPLIVVLIALVLFVVAMTIIAAGGSPTFIFILMFAGWRVYRSSSKKKKARQGASQQTPTVSWAGIAITFIVVLLVMAFIAAIVATM